MTVGPAAYTLENPTGGDPLSNPEHAALHSASNIAVNALATRVAAIETQAPATADQIEQARRVAHEWVIRGSLVEDDKLMLPILWNLTGRPVKYEAAKATVFTASDGGDILLDIMVGSVLTSGSYDPGTQTSILAEPLAIPEGEHTSTVVRGSGFRSTGEMGQDTYLVAMIKQVGAGAVPGADLTIQLNRLL